MNDINNLNNMKQIVISGNNIETLKNYPDNYFDSIVTDPPYGLGKEPNAEEMLRAWIDTGYLEVKGVGFMGKEWDAFIPQPLFWKEIFRVLKHGGHVVSFFGTRTYDWGCMAIRLAGFEIRDCIQWVYGSGFPKSHNISKAINKMGGVEYDEIPASGVGFMKPDSEDWNVTKNQLIQKGESTEQAKQWEGWGSALKPAHEDLVLARKPLEKGLSIAENVLKWGTGAINIDASRIGNELIKGQKAGQGFNNVKGFGVNTKLGNEEAKKYISEDTNGRFPANFILGHHFDCEMKIEKTIYTDTNEEESNEVWNCHDDCPIRILDEQSGISKSSDTQRNRNTIGSFGMPNDKTPEYNDKGGASRFFYIAKANKWERNYGLQEFENNKPMYESHRPNYQNTKGIEIPYAGAGRTGNENRNNHPTVKPIKLMQYLVRMITPPNGIVLDPFAGSGTTGIACKIDGFEFVGLELSEDYTKIANARIESFQEEKVFIDETIIYKNRNKEEDENEEDDTNSSTQLSLF
jgi:DNA modification methylase